MYVVSTVIDKNVIMYNMYEVIYMSKKVISLMMAFVMLLSVFGAAGINAFAEEYVSEPENSFETAPSLKVGDSDTFYCWRGIYTIDGEQYSISETGKVYKFVPKTSAYYQVDISTASKNRSFMVRFGQNYDSEKKTYEIVGRNDGFIDTVSGTNITKAYGYLTAGKTYYIVINSYVDDYDIEPAQSKTAHKIVLSYHKHNIKVTNYSTCRTEECSSCGYYSTVNKGTKFSLSSTSYTYDGKVKKPSVTVKDSNGKKIPSKYYTVTYQGGRKNVGKYSVTIKLKDKYYGSKTLYFTIKPKSTSVSKLTAKKKGFTVKWKKQSAQTTGYQIQYSTSSKFSSAKTVTIGKNTTTSKTVSKLKAKKKYYVRVRTYKTVKINGKNTKIYSSWSKSKTVTTKK